MRAAAWRRATWREPWEREARADPEVQDAIEALEAMLAALAAEDDMEAPVVADVEEVTAEAEAFVAAVAVAEDAVAEALAWAACALES